MDVQLGGEYIRQMRMKQGLRQVDFAEKAGISQMSLSRLERGEKENPGIKELLGVAKALGMSIDYLLQQYR